MLVEAVSYGWSPSGVRAVAPLGGFNSDGSAPGGSGLLFWVALGIGSYGILAKKPILAWLGLGAIGFGLFQAARKSFAPASSGVWYAGGPSSASSALGPLASTTPAAPVDPLIIQ